MGVHHGVIGRGGVGEGGLDGTRGDGMEDDAFVRARLRACLRTFCLFVHFVNNGFNAIGNGFPFPVIIGGQQHLVVGAGHFTNVPHHLVLALHDGVGRLELVLDINGHPFRVQVHDVPKRRHYGVAVPIFKRL